VKKLTGIYLLVGTLLGLCPLFVIWALGLQSHQIPATLSGLIQLHKEHSLYIFLDLFPAVTCLCAYVLGQIQAAQISATTQLRQLVEEKNVTLKETNKKLRAFFNSSSDINVLINYNYAVTAFNRSAAAFMQLITRTQTLREGVHILSLLNEEAKASFKICFEIAAKGKSISFVENSRLLKNVASDKDLWLFIELQPVHDDEGHVEAISMNITDITKRRQIEQAIMQQNTSLKKIAWIQSHHVRKPVANILALISLVKTSNYNYDTELSEILAHLKTSTEELDSCIKEIVEHTSQVEQ